MKVINRNILEAKSGILCHGVNCQKVMGAGLAKEIKKLYPATYEQYKLKEPKLGEVDFVHIGDIIESRPPLIIANCYTQFYYGKMKPYKGAPQHFSYEAFEIVCNTVFTKAKELDYPIHWPKIGSGLGGGDWEKIKQIIEYHETKHVFDKSFLWCI